MNLDQSNRSAAIPLMQADGDGFCASDPASPAAQNDFPLKIHSFSIRTQPHLQVEMDISVRLPNGATVHVTLHTELETESSTESVRLDEPHSTASCAEVPGLELTEAQQQRIFQAVKHLAACVGAA